MKSHISCVLSSRSTQINFSSLCVWITYANVLHKKAAFSFWRSIVSIALVDINALYNALSLSFSVSLLLADPKTRNLIQRKYQSSMVSFLYLLLSCSVLFSFFTFHSHTFAPLHHSNLYICHTVLKEKVLQYFVQKLN